MTLAQNVEFRDADVARRELPNPLPRPPDELARLEAAWAPPKGLSFITEVNNIYVGLFYIGTAMMFAALGGILSVLMRSQLAFPDNDFLELSTYNQVFTCTAPC